MTEDIAVEGLKDGAEKVFAPGETPTVAETVGTPTFEVPKGKETIVERVEGKYQELLSRATPTQTASHTDDDTDEHAPALDAKNIGAMTDEASKVQKLLDLAQTKGVVHAVKVARSLKDYYALDAMHDELSGKLYQGMLEKGLIAKDE